MPAGSRSGGVQWEGTVARTVLYGLGREGGVQHTEVLGELDTGQLRSLAESRLLQFDKVEVWVESVCVVRLRRAAD